MSTYRPLPDCLTIKESEIEGLGLFATEDISQWTLLGITHFLSNGILQRTPLGGFYNFSDTPNCEKLSNNTKDKWFLKPLRGIKAGEEITVKYTFYKI